MARFVMRAPATASIISLLLVTGQVVAQETPGTEQTTETADHGSRSGEGDSRGPGAGDGTGRPPPEDEQPQEPASPAAEERKEPLIPSRPDPMSPLAISIGDGALRFIPSLQYRIRYFHDDGRDFVSGGENDRIRHRARLGMAAVYDDVVTSFVQFQDVRFYGEESDPSGDFSADGLDLHQGYMQFGTGESYVRLGRQEFNFNNERLLGANQYAERVRSFDGARAVAERGGATLDVGWALVRDYATNAEPVGAGKRHIVAGDLKYEMHRAFVPDVFVLFEGDTETDLRRVTAGGEINGTFGDQVYFDYHAEGWVQYGKENDVAPVTYWANLTSFLFRANVDVATKPYLYLEATFVSGDEDPTDDVISTFTQPYSRAHRVLGQMDYFINFIRDTDERGVRDLSSRVGFKPFGLAMDATVHIFDAMEGRADELSHYGWEVDFRMRRRFLDGHVGFDTVYAFFVPGELIAPQVADPELEHFAYVILDTLF